MTRFEKYLEPIKLSGDTESLPYRGYRLDGTYPNQPDLRRDAGIGSCNCCDYFFFPICGDLVLVEDTQLIADIKRKEKDFNYLSECDLNRHIPELICRENVLKVYGSLFALYRFISRCSDFEPVIDSIQFWLVVNDIKEREAEVLNKFRRQLNSELKARLGKTIVNKVEVMTKSNFIGKCKLVFESDTFPT